MGDSNKRHTWIIPLDDKAIARNLEYLRWRNEICRAVGKKIEKITIRDKEASARSRERFEKILLEEYVSHLNKIVNGKV